MDVHAIANALKATGGSVALRWGIVAAVSVGRVDVTLAGSATVIPNVRYMAPYSPTVGDTVPILVPPGGDMLVLGKLA